MRITQKELDTISRQAAIDALKNRWKKTRNYEGNGDDIAEECELYLKQVPSAQPEPCEDAVSRNAIIQKLNTMDRYVSEELILCDTDKKFPKNEVFIVDDVYEEIVENLPSAQPDIIHCGDCKYYDDSDGCFFSTATTGADGFCHWAERKEGEQK